MQYVTIEPSRLPMTNVLVQNFNFQIQTQYNNREWEGFGRFRSYNYEQFAIINRRN